MADFEAERSEFEVVLEMPKASATQYLSVEPEAGKAFADFVLDNEFEERLKPQQSSLVPNDPTSARYFFELLSL